MNYIFSNASPNLFKKFNKSCKYFFAKFEYNIVDHIRLRDYRFQAIDDYKFDTYVVESFGAFKPNIWLTTEFYLTGAILPFYKSLLPKIIRCDIIHLYLYRSANLPFEYFTKLTESGKVEELIIDATKIVDSQNFVIPIEEIFKCVLGAHCIRLEPALVTNKTMKVLNSTKRQIKFTWLELRRISDMLDADDFIEFFKNNFDLENSHNSVETTFENHENTTIFNNHLNQNLCITNKICENYCDCFFNL